MGMPTCGPMAMATSGTVSAAPIFRRCWKSISSGLGPASAGGMPIGSSAMPQIGQVPGPSWTISGSIGQVYLVPAGAEAAAAASALARSAASRKRAGSAMKRSRQRGLQK